MNLFRTTLLTTAIVLLVAADFASAQDAPAPGSGTNAAAGDDLAGVPFAEAVDLSPLAEVAVHVDGRLKSFESFAATQMQRVTGPRRFAGRSPGFTYFDMMLRPRAYEDADVIYIKKKPMREQIAAILRGSTAASTQANLDERLDRFVKRGLISERLLTDPGVVQLMSRLSRDLVSTAKFVDQIEWAIASSRPEHLRSLLRIVPPLGGGFEDAWVLPDEITVPEGDMSPAGQTLRAADAAWRAMIDGWSREDATAVNNAVAMLAQTLPAVNPDVYPDRSKLGWESWYFRSGNMTWVWLIYLLAVIPLIMSVVYHWRGARIAGLALFLIAFGFHTFAIMLRWYVASRWPNSNMFEAVTTSAWFGGCFAILMELLLRRTRMAGVIALTSAVGSMTALMATKFFPLQLNPQIGNMMPVLHDIWLYIHVNVIIFGYCLVFMASVSAFAYLLYRWIGSIRGFAGPGDFARVGGTGSMLAAGAGRTSFGAVLDGVTLVLMELSFVMLWAGIVMGAIWADHSWGRPWGWDPKEVFALNTFIVFAVLIHIRLKVRDKGLWTAWLAVIGCVTMLFNWIFVNFFLVGLHSYA